MTACRGALLKRKAVIVRPQSLRDNPHVVSSFTLATLNIPESMQVARFQSNASRRSYQLCQSHSLSLAPRVLTLGRSRRSSQRFMAAPKSPSTSKSTRRKRNVEEKTRSDVSYRSRYYMTLYLMARTSARAAVRTASGDLDTISCVAI